MEPLMDNKTFTYVKMFAKVWLQTCKWIWFRQRYDYQLGDIRRMGALQKEHTASCIKTIRKTFQFYLPVQEKEMQHL